MEMEGFARQMEEACRKVLADQPGLADPITSSAACYRARLMMAPARKEQEAALAAESGHAGARYEHLLLVAEAFRKRIKVLQQTAIEAAVRMTPGERNPARTRSWSALVAKDEEAAALLDHARLDFGALAALPAGSEVRPAELARGPRNPRGAGGAARRGAPGVLERP